MTEPITGPVLPRNHNVIKSISVQAGDGVSLREAELRRGPNNQEHHGAYHSVSFCTRTLCVRGTACEWPIHSDYIVACGSLGYLLRHVRRAAYPADRGQMRHDIGEV